MDPPTIHPTADVSLEAIVGEGTRIWHQAQVREGARIGKNCIVGKGCYIDFDVVIGDNVKIQNGSCLYHGCRLEDDVFVGPGVILTNDKLPRAINPDGSLKGEDDWMIGEILIRRGASLGAGAIVLPNVVIGEFAMVGAGSVVTKDIPTHGLVMGNPAVLRSFVCRCGRPLKEGDVVEAGVEAWCDHCEQQIIVGAREWSRWEQIAAGF